MPGVPSRAADHLFWLGRYTERLEQLLRILRCVLGRVSGEPGAEHSNEGPELVELITNLGLFPTPLASGLRGTELSQRLLQLIYQPEEPGAVRELLKRVRYIASTVRDRFSGDTWRILGRLDMDACSRPGRLPLASATALIHNLVLDLAAFNGMEMENMTRGRGWRFLDFGRRLERGLSVIKLLDAAAKIQKAPRAVLEPVLEIADSLMTYRRQYFAGPRWAGVLELLVREESNPRSLAFQVNVLRDHTDALRLDPKAANPEREYEHINALTTLFRSLNFNELASQHEQGNSQALLGSLTTWAADLAAISDQVTSRYFSHNIPRVS
jgi:uncharacterized alpha-E superfamily protein